MDRKSIIIIVVSVVLLFGWTQYVKKAYPGRPAIATTNTALVGASNPVAAASVPGMNQVPVATLSAARGELLPHSEIPEKTVVLEDSVARYTFTSHGGGLKSVELKKYPDSVPGGFKSKTNAATRLATLNTKAPTPALTLLAGKEFTGDGEYELTAVPNGIRARKDLPFGISIIKDVQLTSTNYLLQASIQISNRTTKPLRIPTQRVVFGTATPMSPHDNGLLLAAEWFNGTKTERINETWFANRTLGCFPGTPRTEYMAGASNVAWASVQNQFFALIAIPSSPAFQFESVHVDLPPPSDADRMVDAKAVLKPVGYQSSLVYPETEVGAGKTVSHEIELYAGPKQYDTLRQLGRRTELAMNFGGFFGWFAQVLLTGLNLFHKLGFSYGWAIVAITLTIKLMFWPLTAASTRSMKRMQELQPQMKALQEKYKDDPKKMNQKLMEFMKENKVSPVGGCLPMLLQIPVFFGFYTMLQSAIELRGASWLWAFDLSQADTVFMIPGINFPINPLALLMGASMIYQARLTPPAPGVDPVQQKMMQYMPLMMVVFLYNYSAGMTLYWTVQNIFTIFQTKVTKLRSEKKSAVVQPKKA